jgi:hypothetical protein
MKSNGQFCAIVGKWISNKETPSGPKHTYRSLMWPPRKCGSKKMKLKPDSNVWWDKRRPDFAKWISEGQGWFSKMGRWTHCRKQVRREMLGAQGSPGSGQ